MVSGNNAPYIGKNATYVGSQWEECALHRQSVGRKYLTIGTEKWVSGKNGSYVGWSVGRIPFLLIVIR